jgi:hypothetical protein
VFSYFLGPRASIELPSEAFPAVYSGVYVPWNGGNGRLMVNRPVLGKSTTITVNSQTVASVPKATLADPWIETAFPQAGPSQLVVVQVQSAPQRFGILVFVDGSCLQGGGSLERHAQGDPRIGQALCPDCYDYEAAALWNANLGALWRRTITYLPRELAALGGLSVAALRSQVRVAYAKVAEFQARGAVHVHAVIRLDGPDGPDTAPAGGATAQRLAEAVARTAARVAVTVAGPDGRELVVRWGEQVDVRPVERNTSVGEADRVAVAGYLAKYATKDAGAGGGLDRRIRVKGVIERAELSDHARALMRSAWTLSPRWAHNLGFRGHFLTKARRYSVTFAALRGVRAEYRAQADPWLTQIRAKAIGDPVVIRRSFHYAGSGLSPVERAVAASIRGSEVGLKVSSEKVRWRPRPSP